MEYQQRTYREHLKEGRWRSFTCKVKETDLWIGVDTASYQPEMAAFTEEIVLRLRKEMETYLDTDKEYSHTLCPYSPDESAPSILKEMATAARQAGIGPMSAVAGAVAQRVGQSIQQKFATREVIVENGGDIYADIREDMDIAVFAGPSPLSDKVGVRVPAEFSPLGICTSSGTVGPSLSFGKADAVMIICKECALADAYATAFANTIQESGDIPTCVEKLEKEKDILSAICIKDDKVGICGKFKLKLFNHDH